MPRADITRGHSSRVSATEIALIAGAAKTTTGNIAIHAMSHDNSQWVKNSIAVRDGKTGNPSGDQACQPGLNDAENKMAISAGDAQHRMEPFAPITASHPTCLCPTYVRYGR